MPSDTTAAAGQPLHQSSADTGNTQQCVLLQASDKRRVDSRAQMWLGVAQQHVADTELELVQGVKGMTWDYGDASWGRHSNSWIAVRNTAWIGKEIAEHETKCGYFGRLKPVVYGEPNKPVHSYDEDKELCDVEVTVVPKSYHDRVVSEWQAITRGYVEDNAKLRGKLAELKKV